LVADFVEKVGDRALSGIEGGAREKIFLSITV